MNSGRVFWTNSPNLHYVLSFSTGYLFIEYTYDIKDIGDTFPDFTPREYTYGTYSITDPILKGYYLTDDKIIFTS